MDKGQSDQGAWRSLRLAANGRECHEPIFPEGFSPLGNWTKFGLLGFVREVHMPVYDYVCKDCQKSFELVLTLAEHDKDKISCPKCGSKNVEQDAVAFYAVTSKKS
jgi:putative FmdB family regulatory protein